MGNSWCFRGLDYTSNRCFRNSNEIKAAEKSPTQTRKIPSLRAFSNERRSRSKALYQQAKERTAQLKQFQEGNPKVKNVSAPVATPASASSASAAAGSYKMGGGSQPTTAPPPPPQPPKESFARRYKFMWPLLLAVNFTVGAYLFTRTKKKDIEVVGETPTDVSLPAVAAATVVPRNPIPENQQRELFKWILEEKRKMKPKDAEEKKRLEEEKAILKHYIRAKSVPSI
ncbi:hypothetical protein LINPERPRIM_LOCUS1226 [Linum perenne]